MDICAAGITQGSTSKVRTDPYATSRMVTIMKNLSMGSKNAPPISSELASISVITTLIPYIFICLAAYKIFNTKKISLIAGIGAITTLAILVISFMI